MIIVIGRHRRRKGGDVVGTEIQGWGNGPRLRGCVGNAPWDSRDVAKGGGMGHACGIGIAGFVRT